MHNHNTVVIHLYAHKHHIFICHANFYSGPNLASINDFWEMIWDQNVPAIIMVTNFIENAKVKTIAFI